MLQVSQTTGGPVQLLRGTWETGNDHLEDLYDNRKMKLSSNSVQLGKGWDQEQDESALWPAMWKTSDNLANKIYIYIYIYIYICHPQTDCFIVSQLFSVVRHARCIKLGSKPSWLFITQISYPIAIAPQSISEGILSIYLFTYTLIGYWNAQFIRALHK